MSEVLETVSSWPKTNAEALKRMTSIYDAIPGSKIAIEMVSNNVKDDWDPKEWEKDFDVSFSFEDMVQLSAVDCVPRTQFFRGKLVLAFGYSSKDYGEFLDLDLPVKAKIIWYAANGKIKVPKIREKCSECGKLK